MERIETNRQEAGEYYIVRSFVIITTVKVKENMDGTCSTHYGHKKCMQNCYLNRRNEETAETTMRRPTSRIIFKSISEKQNFCGLDSTGLGSSVT